MCYLKNAPKTSNGAIGGTIDSSNAIFCGGIELDRGCMILNSQNEWSYGPNLNFKRYYAGSSQIQNGLLVTGGIGDTIEASMEFYDGKSWRMLRHELPEGLYGHCQISINASLSFIVGGRGIVSGITDKTWFVEVVGLHSSEERVEFTEGPRLNDARHNHGCTYDRSTKTVIVAGGSEKELRLESLNLEIIENAQWQTGPNLPNNSPLEDFDLVYNSKIGGTLLMGGNHPGTETTTNQVWKLNNNQLWTKFDNLTLYASRSGYVAFNVPNSFLHC